LGILRLADQVWVSDNTVPTSRLAIQAGFSQVFPAMTMESWVTDMGEDFLPLKFRFHVSMCGSLGVGADLRKWSDRDFAEARQWIALYKEIRPIIQQGDMFRLSPPFDADFSAVQYVNKDKQSGVLFGFMIYRIDPVLPIVIYPKGLDPNTIYSIEGFSEVRSGAAWMSMGIVLNLGNLDSVLLRIQSV
jgi:alpha-galactosidase